VFAFFLGLFHYGLFHFGQRGSRSSCHWRGKGGIAGNEIPENDTECIEKTE